MCGIGYVVPSYLATSAFAIGSGRDAGQVSADGLTAGQAGIYVPSVGMMTIAMLQRNLYVPFSGTPPFVVATSALSDGMLMRSLRLCSYQDEAQKAIKAAADKVLGSNGNATA